MTKIAFREKEKKEFLRTFGSFFFLTYVLGGILNSIFDHTMLGYYLKTKNMFFIFVLTFLMLFIFVKWFLKWKEQKAEENLIYPVRVRCRDFLKETIGFLDTGNTLCDPVSGKPVLLAERSFFFLESDHCKEETEDCFARLIQEMPQRYCLIPYSSVGGNGLLEGIRVEEVELQKKEDSQCYQEVIIALSDKKLSSSNQYQIILHRELN